MTFFRSIGDLCSLGMVLGGILGAASLFSLSDKDLASAYEPLAIANPAISSQSIEQLIATGLTHYRQGDYQNAKNYFEIAVQSAIRSGDQTSQGLSLTYLSLVQQQLQDWVKAQQSSQAGLKLLRKGSSNAHIALALNTQGRLSFALGQTEQALEEWEQAEIYYAKEKDFAGVTGSVINQAQALTSLGFNHRACKVLFRAIAREGDCNISDRNELQNTVAAFLSQSNPQVRSLGLVTLGNLLRLSGNYEAAEQLLMPLSQSSESTMAEPSLLISFGKLHQAYLQKYAKIYQRTSSVREKSKHLSLALEAASKSFDDFQKAKVATPSNQAWKVLQIQIFQLDLLTDVRSLLRDSALQTPEVQTSLREVPDLQNAIATVPQIQQAILQSELAQLPPSRSVIQGQLQFAEQLLKTENDGDRAHALNYAQIAYTNAQTIQDLSSQSQALGIQGKLYEQAHQWQDAQTVTLQALSFANLRQDPQQIAQLQWQLGRLYEHQGDRTQALQAYQQAVNNLEIVRQNLRVMKNEVEFSFREDVEPVYRQYVSLLLDQNLAPRDRQVSFKQALQVFDDFQVAELEDFLNCNLQLRAKQSPDDSSAFIYPIILSDRIEVIIQLSNQQDLIQYSMPIAAEELNQTLKNLRRELEEDFPSALGLTLSKQVYNWILQPAESHFQNNKIKNLVFVLDGPLRNIPIGALHDGNQYLIEKGYGVALLPGLELFESRANSQEPLKALTFGLSNGKPALPFVTQELNNINQLIDTKQYLNDSFSSQTLESQLIASSFPIVHLATHGQFSSNPDETYIQTWKDQISGDQLSQLLQSRANAPYSAPIELLILSACKTATGDPRAILGLAGIAVQSGARSTISSLWAVEDESTAILMNEFYQELVSSRTITKAEALRRAQVKLMKTEYRAPRYWGAFVLVGDWR